MVRWIVCVVAAGIGLGWATHARGNALTGDIRYRHERIDREGADLRNRERIRARIGIHGQANDNLAFLARLASGSSDPVSTNQTLGDAFSGKGMVLDRAYFDWTPAGSDALTLHLLGGKTRNPFFRPGKSQLLWDGDLNPEGLALEFSTGGGSRVGFFADAGSFWVEERGSDEDSMLLGGQIGTRVGPFTAGVGSFTFSQTEGRAPFFDAGDSFGNSTRTADPDGIPGNGDEAEVYAYEFREFEAFVELGLPAAPLPLTVYGDFAHNSGPDKDNTAYLAGLTLGKAREPGSWAVNYNYRRVERDAVLGVFCDSDFIGGGTDGRGHLIAVNVAVGENAALGATYFADRAPLGNEKDYGRLQVDFVSSFK